MTRQGKMVATVEKVLLVLALMLLFALPLGAVSAQGISGCNDKNPNTPCNVLDPACPPGTSSATLCQDNANPQTPGNNSIYGPNGIITKAARLLSLVVGVAAIIMIMVGGVKYILSQGDAANVQSAKNTLLYAVVGLVIAALAQAFVIFIAKKL